MSRFTLLCSIRNIWSLTDGHRKAYVLDLTSDPDDAHSFDAFFDSLPDLTQSDGPTCPWSNEDGEKLIMVCLAPALTSITAAVDITIPPSPCEDVVPASLYRHWDNERKALTLNALVELTFHVVYEKTPSSSAVPIFVVETVEVIRGGCPWFVIEEVGSEFTSFVATDRFLPLVY
ncbi:hypothetical protein K435DRAFT_866096 [Dendrothele bispora CBS 962.96]|uniref:Uncharacterized protein n=1 Tax=Dendrothele bispora (strain CBS 962.96) TaxID=1314807 RepID=A0A4S8LHX1_DENBC|nr:hypothetical protein K435DRAFT_866096 [Dendrothele bispora CBS 962.96]